MSKFIALLLGGCVVLIVLGMAIPSVVFLTLVGVVGIGVFLVFASARAAPTQGHPYAPGKARREYLAEQEAAKKAAARHGTAGSGQP